jgi:hypothetical protein
MKTTTEEKSIIRQVSMFPNGWSVSIVLITTDKAQEMLQKNSINRRLRPGTVKKYSLIMESGNWLLTPEAICFDADGVLLNGQHRLHAIVSSNTAQECVIWRNVPSEVFSVIDRGQTRSFSDAYGTEKRLSECANFAARICFSAAADYHVSAMVELLQSSHERLIDFCGAKKRIFSSSPFRLAACIHDLIGNGDYAFSVYRDLLHMDTSCLPRIALSIASAVLDGRIKAMGGEASQRQLLARAFKVFDPKCATMSRVQISDVNNDINTIADLIRPNIS